MGLAMFEPQFFLSTNMADRMYKMQNHVGQRITVHIVV